MDNVPLIDVSSESDLLIPSSSQSLGMHTASKVEAEIEKVSKNLKVAPPRSDSPERNKKCCDRYNLRKSLAWDSAFFTCEGILNPEELAIMNSTHSKAGNTLPAIQEELRKSSESTSTLGSDRLVLEHLELNLFENVRGSIKKSLDNSNHTTNCNKIKEQKKLDSSNATTLKKIDVSSQIKLKPPTASRRHYVTSQQQERSSNGGLVCVNKPSHRNGEMKPLIRLPKVSSVAGKKASIEVREIRTSSGKALPGATANQQSIAAFSKANEVPCITRRNTTLSTKSISDSKGVLSLAVVQNTSADRISGHFSSRSSKFLLNVSRIGSKEGSNHPNLSKSSLMLSKVSPVSSIDSVTSESLDDPTQCYINGDFGSRLAKPSGLRLPSPTVGYFDKEKTLLANSNKTPKASLQNSSVKNAGVNNIGATNKKVQSFNPNKEEKPNLIMD